MNIIYTYLTLHYSPSVLSCSHDFVTNTDNVAAANHSERKSGIHWSIIVRNGLIISRKLVYFNLIGGQFSQDFFLNILTNISKLND